MSEKLYKTKYDKWHYDDGVIKLSKEEIDRINTKENEENTKALKEILDDGFVPFPVFFNKNGKLVECTFYIPDSFVPSCSPDFLKKNGNHFNFYIPSYGRAENTLTVKWLKEFHVENYYLAIDPNQYNDYKKYHNKKNIIIRDPIFRNEDMYDMITGIKSPNSYHGTAGIYNSLLYFSRSMGESHYWTIDDDMIALSMKARKKALEPGEEAKYIKDDYYRCSRLEEQYGFSYKEFTKDLEEVIMATRNPGFLGLEKLGLVFMLPMMFKTGTRCYSFYLTSNKLQPDHRGQHNNDVITSLENSKNGLVNFLWEGICYSSGDTQSGGGLTEVYQKFGTLDKGKTLLNAFPDLSKITFNYNRIHHTVNYNTFNKLRVLGAVKNAN